MQRTASHLSPRKDQGEHLLLSMMDIMLNGLRRAQQEHLSECWQMLYFCFLASSAGKVSGLHVWVDDHVVAS